MDKAVDLGVLTAKVAKPAVAFGGKYRIIDFPLSNCINSGVDTVGVLTQYQPSTLEYTYWYWYSLGFGSKCRRGINSYRRMKRVQTVSGTPVLQTRYIRTWSTWKSYNPDYVLILSGDHIYKMDYEVMLGLSTRRINADVTIAAMPVPMEEASRFGIVVDR